MDDLGPAVALDGRLRDVYGVIGLLDVITNDSLWRACDEKISKGDGRSTESSEIDTWHQLAQDTADAKVVLADNAYDMVEDVIRHLDEELSSLQSTLRQRGADVGESTASETKPSRRRGHPRKPSTPKPRAHPSAGAESEHEDVDMDVDPGEPEYCFCRQVAFGRMIACDNPTCPIEWFHYACVHLHPGVSPPEHWLCPICSGSSHPPATAVSAATSASSAGVTAASPHKKGTARRKRDRPSP